jgi:hypothetical protein
MMMLLLGACITVAYAQEQNKLPASEKGKLVYQNTLADKKAVADWVMEGPGVLKFKDGWMEMYSPGEKWDHVFWCPCVFPADFIAEWDVKLLKKQGLLIVFFAARGNKGQGIFNADLPKRDGTFKYYNKGQINCYHISYYANNPKHPDRGNSRLRKDPGAVLLQTGKEGIDVGSFKKHHIRLVKDGGHITMYVDDKKIIDYMDDGKVKGPVYTSGNIGFRQMRWSDGEYSNFKVWKIKHNDR